MATKIQKTLLAIFMTALALPAAAQWSWTPQTGRLVNLNRMPKETPELQLEHARGLMLDNQPKKALDETEKFVEFYEDSEFADDNQFLRGEIQLSMGDYMKSARTFQQVISAYPDTNLYDQAIEKQYVVADHYYDEGQLKINKWYKLRKERPLNRALEVYSMVIENEPFTDAAAQAQYKRGLCYYTKKDFSEAAFEYRRVVEDYSGSEWVDEASYGLATTFYDGALPADYDQTHSQLAITAIDQFKDRYPADERNTELAEKRIEMRESLAEQQMATAKFYEKRRNFAATRIYLETLVKDYSDTSYAQEAQAWLDEHQGVDSLRNRYAKQGAQ